MGKAQFYAQVQCICLAVLALNAPARNAHASVLEISPEGAVVVYEGPALIRADSVTPIPATSKPARQTAANARELAGTFASAAAQSAISPSLLQAVASVESHFQQSARSPKGALGVMQLMPATAASLNVDPNDVGQNNTGGAKYLSQMLTAFHGDLSLTRAA